MCKYLVLNWLNCLGKIRRYGLAGGGLSLETSLEVSKDFVNWDLSSQLLLQHRSCLLDTMLPATR